MSITDDGPQHAGVQQARFWLAIHVTLLAAFVVGLGWEALFIWYLPARMAALWLAFIFAWFPHHPADRIGRYVDTRVAVFPGARWLARGDEHHAPYATGPIIW